MRLPFVIFADFECLNIPVEGAPIDPEKSSFCQVSKQDFCSYYYMIVRSNGQAKDTVLYCVKNAEEPIRNSHQAELEEINEVITNPEKSIMSEEDQISFPEVVYFHICSSPLGEEKVRGHCQITESTDARLTTNATSSFEFIRTKLKYLFYFST